MTSNKRILAVGVDKTLFARIDSVLRQSVGTLDRIPRGGSALALCGHVPFDLMIVGDPLPDMDLAAFLAALRETESACGRSPVLVLTEESRLVEVRRLLQRDQDLALPAGQTRRLLDEIARRLLDAQPRV